MTDSTARTAPCWSNHLKSKHFFSTDEGRQSTHWGEPLRHIQCTPHVFPCSEGSHQVVSTNVLTCQGTPLQQMPKLVHQIYIEKVIVGWQGPDTQWNSQHMGQEWESCPIWMRSLWQLQSWGIKKPGVTTSKLSILIWVLWHPKSKIKRNDPLLEEQPWWCNKENRMTKKNWHCQWAMGHAYWDWDEDFSTKTVLNGWPMLVVTPMPRTNESHGVNVITEAKIETCT